MGAAFVEALPIGRFHGVGPVTADKMNRLGILTGADLRKQSLAFLQQHFGKSGPWYHAIANGEDDRPVVPNRPRKSSGSETTFANDLTDPAGIEAGVLAMADHVWTWCEKANAFGRTVTVKIKYANFRQATRSQSLSARITSAVVLRQVSLDLVRAVFPPEQGVRLVGVAVSNFGDNQVSTSEQFDLALNA
jgi:DNA polymerase IV